MIYDWLEVMIGLEVAIGLRTKDLNIFTSHFAKLRSLDRSNKMDVNTAFLIGYLIKILT